MQSCTESDNILHETSLAIVERANFILPGILPSSKKSIALLNTMSFCITLKRKLQHVGHKWIICESHLDCPMGQVGQQVWTAVSGISYLCENDMAML